MPYLARCRECEWVAPMPVDLKGTANVQAGRHISDTGHSVDIERLDGED